MSISVDLSDRFAQALKVPTVALGNHIITPLPMK